MTTPNYRLAPEIIVPKTVQEKAKKIKLVVTDADGVLTIGHLFMDKNANELFGQYSIIDGMGIVMARNCGIATAVISGRSSECLNARCKYLGITQIHTNISNKSQKLTEIATDNNLNLSQIAYIGDDIIDIAALKIAGLKAAPRNAQVAVKQIVDYVTYAEGGDGALRELIDIILQTQGLYDKYVDNLL